MGPKPAADMPDLLRQYVEHLHARLRARSNKPAARDEEEGLAVLPDSVSRMCAADPAQCLALIVAAIHEVSSPHLIQAIGDELLENLLNEHSSALHAQVATLLRTDQRFRFAFASGVFSSVDPSLIDEWLQIFRDLGTTKQGERKRLWKMPHNPA